MHEALGWRRTELNYVRCEIVRRGLGGIVRSARPLGYGVKVDSIGGGWQLSGGVRFY